MRHPPESLYSKLPCAVFGLFVLCFVLFPASPLYTHHFSDPDHYMRLNEVVGWLQGQSWYDLSVPRMSPGAHTVVHWSRLIDLPIALIALPLIPKLGVSDAVMSASFIIPFLWLGILLLLLPALAKPIVGEARSKLSCALLLFAPLLLFCFTPGNVDHHGVQVLIAGFGLLGFVHIVRDDQGRLYAALTALAFSCGFWIGTEALPWAALFVACLGISAAWRGGNVARNAALFGICFPLFVTLLIPVALPASEFSSLALSWFSPAYAIIAALSGAALILGWVLGRFISNNVLRVTIYMLLGGSAICMFFALIPKALQGPFIDYDEFDATVFLDNIKEAQPLIHALAFNRFMPVTAIPAAATFVHFLFLPLVALTVCIDAARRAPKNLRLVWLAQAVFLIASMALTVFWQLRVGKFMEFFALIPLTYLLGIISDKLKEKSPDVPVLLAVVGVYLFLVPLSNELMPTRADATPISAPREKHLCLLEPLIPILNDSEKLGAKPLTIMNVGDAGAQLVFATKHNVVAGNYDVPGNKDAFTFFSATEDAPAQAAARKWNADLVLLCRTVPLLFLGKDYYSFSRVRLLPGNDGLLHLTNTDAAQPLIQRLIRGQIPDWLEPIELFGTSDYLLFRIKK